MDITQSNLDILFREANLAYQDVLQRTPTWYQQVATVLSSKSRSMDYGWLDRLPQLRKWVGARVVNAATTQSRRVVNVPFEHTIALSKWDILDDQFGVFNLAVLDQANAAAKWPDVTIAQWFRDAASSVLSDGTPNLGFDGLPPFSTVHPIQAGVDSGIGGTQSNLYLNTGLSWDNYVKVRTGMMSLKGADGQPLNLIPDLLIVPPQLESLGKLILEADTIPTTTVTAQGATAAQSPMTNTYKGTAKLLMIPELADKPNNWWLFCTSKSVKPVLWQLRTAPIFTPRTNPQDPVVFDSAQFLYGVEARAAAAETVWYLGAAATSAASY